MNISRFQINILSGPVTTLLNFIFTFVGYPLYLSFLGFEMYGCWLVLATVISFSQIGNLGIGPTIIKFTSEFAEKDVLKVSRYFITSKILLIGSGVVLFLILLTFRIPIVESFRLDSINTKLVLKLLPYVGILSVFLFVVQVSYGVLSGLDRMDLANIYQVIGRGATLMISIILMFFDYGVYSLLIGNIIGAVVQYALTNWQIRRINNGIRLRVSYFRKIEVKELLTQGLPLFYSSLVNILVMPLNKFFIVRFIGVEMLPIFEISYNGAMQIRRFFESGFKALLPEITKMVTTSESDSFQNSSKTIKSNIAKFMGIGTVSYIILFFISPFMLQLWLKDSNSPELERMFRVLLFATYMSLLGVPAYYYFIAASKTRLVFVSHLIMSTINILLLFVMIVVNQKSLINLGYSLSVAFLISTLFLNYKIARNG